MEDLRKDNGAGATECKSDDPRVQKTCTVFDNRQRGDGSQLCFRFRDFNYGFWICTCIPGATA